MGAHVWYKDGRHRPWLTSSSLPLLFLPSLLPSLPPNYHIMVSTKLQFTLPDLLAACPFKDATNPHYKEAAAESRAWINSYNVFTDRKRAFFVQGSNELLCSHVYAYAGYEQFRTCCDFVSLIFFAHL